MMRSVSLKVSTVAAILALGSVGLAHDALAKGGGGGGGGSSSFSVGGGHVGGAMGGGHFGGDHFGGGRFDGGRVGRDGRFAGNFHDHGRRFFFGGPFYGDLYGDYGYYGSDCWTTERVGPRWRRVWVCD
jgi:hypothetical protein